jgi:hypothetical protein
MDCIGHYYTVVSTLRNAPLHDHLQHGYEYEDDFRKALRAIISRWKGRVGECVDEHNGFLSLRFYDTPGGKPDEARLPSYLLQETAITPYSARRKERQPDPLEEELDKAFGFD